MILYFVPLNLVLVVFRLCVTVQERDYPTARKTFTSRLKRYKQFRWKGSPADSPNTLLLLYPLIDTLLP